MSGSGGRLVACVAISWAVGMAGCGEEGDTLESVTLFLPAETSGPTVFEAGVAVTVTVPEFESSTGHPLDYQYDWGDGEISDWGGRSRPHTWETEGYYTPRVRARCAEHTDTISSWYIFASPVTAMPPGPCSVYPRSLDFGAAVVGGPVASLPVVFYNATSSSRSISPGSACEHDFTMHPAASLNLPPRGHYEVTVEFHPTAVGLRACTFEVTDCMDLLVTGLGRSQ